MPFSVVAGAGVILAVMGGTLALTSRSPFKLLQRLWGVSITVNPSVTDVGDGHRFEVKTVPVLLVNQTDHPIRIIGGRSDCSCVSIGNLPLIVPPQDSKTINIGIKYLGGARTFQRSLILYTDRESQLQIVAQLKGRLVEPSVP